MSLYRPTGRNRFNQITQSVDLADGATSGEVIHLRFTNFLSFCGRITEFFVVLLKLSCSVSRNVTHHVALQYRYYLLRNRSGSSCYDGQNRVAIGARSTHYQKQILMRLQMQNCHPLSSWQSVEFLRVFCSI